MASPSRSVGSSFSCPWYILNISPLCPLLALARLLEFRLGELTVWIPATPEGAQDPRESGGGSLRSSLCPHATQHLQRGSHLSLLQDCLPKGGRVLLLSASSLTVCDFFPEKYCHSFTWWKPEEERALGPEGPRPVLPCHFPLHLFPLPEGFLRIHPAWWEFL